MKAALGVKHILYIPATFCKYTKLLYKTALNSIYLMWRHLLMEQV